MSMTSFRYVFIVKLEHISQLFLVFTVNFEQLDACWNWIIHVHCSETYLKRTPISGTKQGVPFRRCSLLRAFLRNESKAKRKTQAKQSMDAETFLLPLTWSVYWFRSYLDYQLKQRK